MSSVGRTESPPLPTLGCWLNLMEPTIGELVGPIGYDVALIDMEHSSVSLADVLPMIRAVQSGGARAVVRAPESRPYWISRLMDAGVDGVMAPMVNSVTEARQLAAASRYAPDGTRGMAAGLVRASDYGLNLDRYLETGRSSFLLIAQIETRDGLEAAPAIAAVDGIDCLFVGPYDLSGSLGFRAQPDHEAVRQAIAGLIEAVAAVGVPIATLPTPERNVRQLRADGFDLVFSGSDLGLLRAAMQEDVAANR